MKNTPLPKLIKWVVSGAIHPIVLFDEDLMRELTVRELGPEYASNPFPWAFNDKTTGKTFYRTLDVSLRKHYKSDAHFRRHAEKISERVLYVPETTAEDIQRLVKYISKSYTIDSFGGSFLG